MKFRVLFTLIHSGFVDVEFPDNTDMDDIDTSISDTVFSIPLDTLIKEADDCHIEIKSYERKNENGK